MLRSSLLAMLCVAFSLALAVSAAPAASSDAQCAAKQAILEQNNWDILCGVESSCGAGSICMRALGRDAIGDFYVCRCSGSGMSKCCQLILRSSSHRPEAMGSCLECGQTGECSMSTTPTVHKAACIDGDVGRS